MINGLEELAKMEYPGRVIIMGVDPEGNDIIGYAVTGRSESSRARKFVVSDNGDIWTNPTDEEVMKRGDAKLLVYPAIMMGDCGIAVSNGAQTSLVYTHMKRLGEDMAEDVLKEAFFEPYEMYEVDVTRFEPDAPNFTPRISGVLNENGAALSIIRRGKGGEAEHNIFGVPFTEGRGKLLTTYTGVNKDPLPSFEGNPIDIGINTTSAEDFARQFYDAMKPMDPARDFRVAVAVVKKNIDGVVESYILNRADADQQLIRK